MGSPTPTNQQRLGIGTPQDAADLLGVHLYTIRDWCRKGQIPAFRAGPKLWRIDLDALVAIKRGAK